MLVTGATSGIGLATAKGVARLGAGVVLTARGHDRAERAVAAVLRAAPAAEVSYLLADMGEFDQVRGLAEEFLAAHDRLDVLVHNAGALTRPAHGTGSGTELTVASQVAGPFLLTGLLLPALRAGRPSRVIQVSSGGMYTQRFDLASLEMGPDEYDGTVAYARAKRAQLVLMHEWVRRTAGTGVFFHAMHPGWADTPGIRGSLPRVRQGDGPAPAHGRAGGGHDRVAGAAAGRGGRVERAGSGWTGGRGGSTRSRGPGCPARTFADAGAALWAWCAGPHRVGRARPVRTGPLRTLRSAREPVLLVRRP